MIILIKTNNRYYRFNGAKSDKEAIAKLYDSYEARLYKTNKEHCGVVYDCDNPKGYRIIAGFGNYEKEPYPDKVTQCGSRLLNCEERTC